MVWQDQRASADVTPNSKGQGVWVKQDTTHPCNGRGTPRWNGSCECNVGYSGPTCALDANLLKMTVDHEKNYMPDTDQYCQYASVTGHNTIPPTDIQFKNWPSGPQQISQVVPANEKMSPPTNPGGEPLMCCGHALIGSQESESGYKCSCAPGFSGTMCEKLETDLVDLLCMSNECGDFFNTANTPAIFRTHV